MLRHAVFATVIGSSALTSLGALGACGGSAPETRAGSSSNRAPASGLDPMTPLEVGERKLMLQWIDDRIGASRDGHRERVRIPLIHRKPGLDCPECPSYAIAVTGKQGPYFWLELEDRSGVTAPEGDWLGWAEGRFTGEERQHSNGRGGGPDITLPVFEVMVRESRAIGEPAVARVMSR